MNQPIRVKADIVPYTPEYARTVHSWIESAETYKNVCRGSDFPPSEDIVDSWQREGVTSYLVFAQNRPVAYAELWDRPLELAVEIAHLIVPPLERYKGYGTLMLELIYQRGAQRGNVSKVLINLYGDSEIVLGCYLKAGFELFGTATHTTGLKLIRIAK